MYKGSEREKTGRAKMVQSVHDFAKDLAAQPQGSATERFLTET